MYIIAIGVAIALFLAALSAASDKKYFEWLNFEQRIEYFAYPAIFMAAVGALLAVCVGLFAPRVEISLQQYSLVEDAGETFVSSAWNRYDLLLRAPDGSVRSFSVSKLLADVYEDKSSDGILIVRGRTVAPAWRGWTIVIEDAGLGQTLYEIHVPENGLLKPFNRQ